MEKDGNVGCAGAGSATAGGRVVVFDLDGTIVAGDAFGAYLRHLLVRSRWRLTAAVVTAPGWGPALLVRPTRSAAERWLVWLAAFGMDDTAFAAAARLFASHHARHDRVAVAALARVRDHLEAGDRVIVATGCAAPLAQEVCAAAGLHDVEVICSALTRSRWGAPGRSVPARGEGKVRALRAAGVGLPVDHAYSDSASDLPLLRAARTPHVVDPRRRDRARLQKALGDDVDVLLWAGRPAPDG